MCTPIRRQRPLASPASFLTTTKRVFKALPYNPDTDFVAMTTLVNQALVRVVNDKAKFGTVASILAAAKANPGKLTYASPGDDSPHHLAGLMLQAGRASNSCTCRTKAAHRPSPI